MAKILLLEDNQVNRDMLVRRLKQQGYSVVTGNNGTEALPQALSEGPDLILMDMSMPVMDGWEATQQLKRDDRVQHIPVLALTAHAMAGDREKALAVGCDDYDSKPINMTRLVGKIEALLPDIPEPAPPRPVEPTTQNDPVERLLLRHLRHELCTPINAIIGYSEILLDELPVQQATQQVTPLRDDINKVHEAGLQLLAAADAILNPAQLETHPVAKDINSFSARVRLELLTPLSTVMGYSEMLLEEATEPVLSDLKRIDTAARQLLAMIKDIVNLAQQQLQTLNSQTSVMSQLQLDSLANQRFAQTANRLIQAVQDTSPRVAEGNILVVDDNIINCDLFSRQLDRYGYTVTTVNGGRQALEQLTGANYDLILLDIFMPDMNGLDVLSQIKQHPLWKTIPVIMISALDELNSVVHCIEMGAEDFVSKPVNPILLQAKISTCLEKRRLRDQQALYIAQRVIAGATPVPIVISRIENGQILYTNRAAEMAIGLSAEDLLQRSALEFYRHPEDRADLIAAVQQSTEVQYREVECQRANGEPFWAAATMQPLVFEQEQTLLTVLYDISDRKRTEHALKQAEENYRSLFENAGSGLYQSCPQGQFLRVNRAMAEIHGYGSPEDMMAQVQHIGDQIYVNAFDRTIFEQQLNDRGEVHGFEYQAYRQDGEMIWLSENARRVQDAYGETAYYEGIVEDITQRKLTEAKLKREVEELRIEIDDTKRQQSVADIVGSSYFQEMQAEVDSLRSFSDLSSTSSFGPGSSGFGTGNSGFNTETVLPAEMTKIQPTVLVVEDNVMNRDMVIRRLHKFGYAVETAENGQEGVIKATQSQPDIVLMDMSLPVMDGWEATRNLKANPDTRQIPIIALTAHAMATDREKALAAGCDEYDTKPIDWTRLMGKVEALLERVSR